MCDPGCTCIDETNSDDDDNVQRRRRRRKKPNYRMPRQSISSFPPDHPNSKSSLPIYSKGIRFLKK